MYINNRKFIDKLNRNNFCIVIDFDRTVSKGTSEGTWATIGRANIFNDEYQRLKTEQYEKYRPIEVDPNISHEIKEKNMEAWWKEHFELFFRFGLKKEDIVKCATQGGIVLRDGAEEFFSKMHEYNVPIIILSAGLANIIKEFLSYKNILYDNVYIFSNDLLFDENGMLCNVDDNIIHACNKTIDYLPDNMKKMIASREYILMYGDGLADLSMVPERLHDKTIKVGFLVEAIEESLEAFNKNFDIVLLGDDSFKEVNDYLNIYNL